MAKLFEVKTFKDGKAVTGYVITDEFDKVKLILSDAGYETPNPEDIKSVNTDFILFEKGVI